MIALYIFAFLVERRRTARFLFQAAGLVLAGFISATILLSLVHASFGRSFLFFVPLIELIAKQRYRLSGFPFIMRFIVTPKPSD